MCSPRFFYQIEPDLGLLRGELEQILFMAACERLDASQHHFLKISEIGPEFSDGCEMPDGGHPRFWLGKVTGSGVGYQPRSLFQDAFGSIFEDPMQHGHPIDSRHKQQSTLSQDAPGLGICLPSLC